MLEAKRLLLTSVYDGQPSGMVLEVEDGTSSICNGEAGTSSTCNGRDSTSGEGNVNVLAKSPILDVMKMLDVFWEGL